MLLFGALGLVLVMIWQSWVEFQQERSAVDGLTSEQGAGRSDGATRADLSEDVPEAPEMTVSSGSAGSDDVVGEVGVVEEENVNDGRIINVTTDLVKAQIDTLGGDLIRVELLKHPVSVDTPDIPFVLMHRDNSGLFVAQSGLIGQGREYPNHNVEFSASQFEYRLGDDQNMAVVLTWSAPDGVDYEKIFHFQKDRYRIEIDFRVTNNSDQPWTGFVYGQLKQTGNCSGRVNGFPGSNTQLQRGGDLYRRRQVRQDRLRRDSGRAFEHDHCGWMGGDVAALFCGRLAANGVRSLPVVFRCKQQDIETPVSHWLQDNPAGGRFIRVRPS